jgi:hypothetical protein
VQTFRFFASGVRKISAKQGDIFFAFCIKFYEEVVFLKTFGNLRMVKCFAFHLFAGGAIVGIKLNQDFFGHGLLGFHSFFQSHPLNLSGRENQ